MMLLETPLQSPKFLLPLTISRLRVALLWNSQPQRGLFSILHQPPPDIHFYTPTTIGLILELFFILSMKTPKSLLENWIEGFIMQRPTDTLALLKDISNGIFSQISYKSREAEGTQHPTETLNKASGSCRDFAVLFLEAARNTRLWSAYRFRLSIQS